MGRYTTVQAYADNNPNMRAVDYDQATGKISDSASAVVAVLPANRGPVVAEKVDNPYGSTAGAGSGEFHVYRHARAREMERWKKINADEAEKKAEEEFQKKAAEDTASEAEKTKKRRRKRERAKEAKRRKKNMRLGCVGAIAQPKEEEGGGEEEFEYTSVAASDVCQGDVKSPNMSEKTAVTLGKTTDEVSDDIAKPASAEERNKVLFANDGSFLERMKKELANT